MRLLNEPIRVALVGTGFAASTYAQALRHVPGLQLALVVGKDVKKAASFAESVGISAYTDDVAVALGSAKVAGVILAVPPAIQPPLAVKAFENGKHVLCEKPLGTTLAEAEAVTAAWKRSGCVGMVNFCYRLVPEIEALKDRAESGECGDLQSVHVDWVLSSRLDRSLSYHWKNQRELGGGVLQIYGTHVMDYLFHDRGDVKACCATRKTYVESRPDAAGVSQKATADEVTTVLFRFRNSIPVVVHLSLVTRPSMGHRIVVRGSAGTLEAINPDPISPGGPFYLYRHVEDDVPGRSLLSMGSREESTMPHLFSRVLCRFSEGIVTASQKNPSIEDGLKVARLVNEIDSEAASTACVA